MEWINFLVTHKLARGTDGIINADDLIKFSSHKVEEHYYCVFNLRKDKLKIEHDTGAMTEEKVDPKTGTIIKSKKIYSYHPQTETQIEGRLTSKQYEGPTTPALGLVMFDFDSTDENKSYIENVRAAYKDALSFMEWTGVKDPQIAFSGSKGFHVAIPFAAFNLEADEHLCANLHDMAGYLKQYYKTLDTTVYNANRKFRVLNTQHPKTNLFKTIVPKPGMPAEEILELAKTRQHELTWRLTFDGVEKSKALDDALEEAAKIHAYDKGKAGTSKRMTPFEAYDGKSCIKRLIDNKCEEGGRNNTCLIIVNDLFKTGKTKDTASRIIHQWCLDNGLPLAEGMFIVDNIFDGRAYYNHGCQDAVKAANCSAKCPLWKKLDPDKRPVPVDAPKIAYIESQKKFKLPARYFIEGFIEKKVVKVDLADNWYLSGKYVAQSDIETEIYCSALDNKRTVDPCSMLTINAYLTTWKNDQKDSLLADLRNEIRFDPSAGDEDLRKWLLGTKRDADETDLVVMKHWLWLVKRKIGSATVANHIMPIFSGLSGSGKSESIRKLISPLRILSSAMDMDVLNDERQSFRLIQYYILFLDEMAKADKADINSVKNKITLDYVSYRKLGTNSDNKGPANASFIGCSNPRVVDIIKDPDSARRFYELHITEVGDWEAVNSCDYRKVWKGIDESLEFGYMVGEHLKEVRVRQELIRDRDTVEEWLEFKELKLRPDDGAANLTWIDANRAYDIYLEFMSWQKKERFAFGTGRFFRTLAKYQPKKRVTGGMLYAFPATIALSNNGPVMALSQPVTASNNLNF